jgi:hypothetical protein
MPLFAALSLDKSDSILRLRFPQPSDYAYAQRTPSLQRTGNGGRIVRGMPVLLIRRIQGFANVAAMVFGLLVLGAGLAVIISRW